MNAILEFVIAGVLWTGLWWAILAAGIAVWFWVKPPQTASVRHAALAAAIIAGTLAWLIPRWGAGVVSLPETVVATPSVDTPRAITPEPREHESITSAIPDSFPVSVPVIADAKISSPPSIKPSAAGATPVVSLRDWFALGRGTLVAVWMLGVFYLSVRLILAARMTLRWRREAQPLSADEMAQFVALRRELGVRRATNAGLHSETFSPIVLCGWPPLVLAPNDWSTWKSDSRNAAWRHELAHVRRGDDWWRMLSEGLRVLWWFHPGVHWLLSRREHEAELLSDEAAVAAGCPPQELAQLLLDACRRPQTKAWVAPAGTFFSPRTMKLRITRLLDAPSVEALCRPAPRGLRLAAILGVTLLVLAGSMRWITVANSDELPAPPADKTEVVAANQAPNNEGLDAPAQEPIPLKPKANYITVVGRLLDDATDRPIERAGWEWGMFDPKKPEQIAWGHSRQSGGSYPDGKFETLVNIGADGNHYPLRVYSAGYETTEVLIELAKPYPERIERIVKLKRGRSITGVLRDHDGKPIANGSVFFIPKGHRSNIVEGHTGADWHGLSRESRDGAVSEVRTSEDGTFSLPTGAEGTLAASSDQVDLWPFALPEDGHTELKMPAPSYLVIDLTYWYLEEFAKQGPQAHSPDSEDPNQCWIKVDRVWPADPLWKESLAYSRQMLVFAKDPLAKLSKGVVVGQVIEWEMLEPIPDIGHNKNVSTTIRVALPPGHYRVQRLRAGPFAPVGEQIVELKSGEDTVVSWASGNGSSVRGKATWPANTMFIRQPGEEPRKVDWTVPDTATVRIAPIGGDGMPIEAAKIQPDGSFFIATNLDPGQYNATVHVYMPEADFSGGYRGADCNFSQEFTVPNPVLDPFGSPPVEVEVKMDVGKGGRFVVMSDGDR